MWGCSKSAKHYIPTIRRDRARPCPQTAKVGSDSEPS